VSIQISGKISEQNPENPYPHRDMQDAVVNLIALALDDSSHGSSLNESQGLSVNWNATPQVDAARQINRLEIVLPDGDVLDLNFSAALARASLNRLDFLVFDFQDHALQLQVKRHVKFDPSNQFWSNANLHIRMQLRSDGMLLQGNKDSLARPA